MSKQIETLQQLADEIGCETPERIAKAIFKDTECGCVFYPGDSSITVAGYAEGAQAECPDHVLEFPFTAEQFWRVVAYADAEGVEMWNEWNSEEDA